MNAPRGRIALRSDAPAPRHQHLVRDLTVTYPNGSPPSTTPRFALDPGTICALVGVNGSGKSTIFKAIMGFVRPSAGEVQLCGMAVDEALKQNLVAYVPQSEEVDWNFPVLVETVVMMGRYGHMNFLRIPSRADRHKVDAGARARRHDRLPQPPDRRAVAAGRRSACSSPARSRRRAASSCSTSRSPAST